MHNTLESSQRVRSPSPLFTGLAPATLGVLIQCATLIFVFFSVLVIGFFTSYSFPIFILILLQSIIATGFCILIGMANWWRWIHFCFPLALWSMSMLHILNEVYLTGFLISLGLFWTTFRSQVPFFPSRPIVWQKVAELIPQDKPIRMIDIGSGLGDLAMHIAKMKTASRIEGIEVAPLPWLVSVVRSYLKGNAAVFKLGDYRELDFAQYDVVFAYLSPAAMPALWEKAHREMSSGSLLISYEFEVPGVSPTFCINTTKQSIYVWEM